MIIKMADIYYYMAHNLSNLKARNGFFIPFYRTDKVIGTSYSMQPFYSNALNTYYILGHPR